MGTPITVDGVQDTLDGLLSGKYIGKEQGTDRNVQVSLANLKALSDYEKCKLLVAGADELQAKGFIRDVNDAVRLSFDTKETDSNGKPIYAPWPCLWVNHPTRTEDALSEVSSVSTENAKKIDNLADTMTSFMEQMKNMIGGADVKPSNPTKGKEDDTPF